MSRSPASLGASDATDALTMAMAAHRVGKRDAAERVADVTAWWPHEPRRAAPRRTPPSAAAAADPRSVGAH